LGGTDPPPVVIALSTIRIHEGFIGFGELPKERGRLAIARIDIRMILPRQPTIRPSQVAL
jgi:hypothetical protein